ncbi:MAG: hypothetical protein IJ409_07235 [Lachnospiraceae bacterium]|nr:hypothetical protein [Lachnospiraceae bacterium]
MSKQRTEIIKLLIYGMIGAVVTMIGDCLLLGVDSTGEMGVLGQYIVSAEKLSYTRIGLAGFFGFIGIPVTAFGFYALYQMLEDKASTLSKIYKASVYGYVALGGAIHVICCYLVTGIKKALETGTAADDILATILAEQGGYVIPAFVVFWAFYFINVAVMIMIIIRKKTVIPKWMWILNPFVFKVLINGIGKLGTGAFLNGLACSNMSLGALIIFIGWMIVVLKTRDERRV